MYNWDQELYFRCIWFVRNQLDFDSAQVSLRGRSYPSIVRQDEEIRLPGEMRARDFIALITLLIAIEERNDYCISKIIDQGIKLAQRNKYQGDWRFFEQLNEYFDISSEEELSSKKQFAERLIFNQPDYFDFLAENYSLDDIFGNILRRSISMFYKIRIKKIKISVTDFHVVKYPQRHRGYRDKGSLADEGTRARRKIIDRRQFPKQPKLSSMDQIMLWGDLPPEEE